MTKGMRKTGLLLLLCFLAVSAQQWIQAKATSSDVTDGAELGQRILLTNDKLKPDGQTCPPQKKFTAKKFAWS